MTQSYAFSPDETLQYSSCDQTVNEISQNGPMAALARMSALHVALRSQLLIST